jgi:hypothetical protein
MTHAFRPFAVLVIGAAVGWSSACKSSSTSSGGDGSGNQGGSSAGESTGGNGGNSGSASGGLSAAMGGSSGATGGSGAAGSNSGGSSSGAGGSDPSGCGNQTCTANQVCIRPCCGGTAPRCTPRPQDGGACPPGTDPVNFCPGSSGAGCQDSPCTPRAPFCTDVPAACGSNLTCPCLGNVCAPGACGVIDGRTVICMCA